MISYFMFSLLLSPLDGKSNKPALPNGQAGCRQTGKVKEDKIVPRIRLCLRLHLL